MTSLSRHLRRVIAWVAVAVWSAGALATTAGTATLAAEERIYRGTHVAADKLISIDIDGQTYKGHYASNAEDLAGATSDKSSGAWGRAFLFSSSSRVLRCQLDTGFPVVSGRCQAADGGRYRLVLDAAPLPPRDASSTTPK